MQAASPWTEAVMLYSACAPNWFVWLLYSPQCQPPAPARSRIRAIALFCLTLAWTGLAFAVVRYNFDRPLFGDFPARTLICLVVPCSLAWLFRRPLTTPALSQHTLISLQLFRVIGALFLLECWRGTLPAVFALPAGIGDVAVALTAALVLYRYRDSPIPNRAVRLVAWLGIADFTSAFFFGFTSSATPVQLFSFAHPNTVDLYPTGLIPEFLVPFATVGHILSLTQAQSAPAKAPRQPPI